MRKKHEVTDLRTIELIPDVSIRLAVVSRIEPLRFKTVFLQVWEKIPFPARAKLVGYWSVLPATVYFTSDWQERGSRLAQCWARGSVFCFLASAIDRMSDMVMGISIAHELAHAYCFATNEPNHCGSPLPEAVRYEQAEAIVRSICDLWGFCSRELSQWCLDNEEWLTTNANAGP